MMSISDKTCGKIQLALSFVILIYLFILLIILPILPIEENWIENYTPPNVILNICGIFGLMFIGSLGIFTIYTIMQSKV